MISVSDVDDLERRLRRLNAAITAAEASVAALDTRIDTLEVVTDHLIVRAAGVTTAVGTTATDLVVASLPVPADWNTYDIDVHWGCRFLDSSGGNTGVSTTVTVQIDLDGLIMAGTQSLELQDTNTLDLVMASGLGWAEDRTTTGTRTITLQALRGGSPTLDALSNRMRVEAWRTS